MNAHRVIRTTKLVGTKVVNADGQHLGKIEDVVVDLSTGEVCYAALSFGGILGMGNKLFALPWKLVHVDTTPERVVVSVSRDLLEKAEGFDKDDWPDLADVEVRTRLHRHYTIQMRKV
jgi:sporulation protein YlmC with PRC-barrel domain